MKKRIALIRRKTRETDISVSVNLDGTGKYKIETGINFLNHMLEIFARHSMIDLKINAIGDLKVDEHHTVEDIGICLGEAICKALGKKRGIFRYGFFAPMDEALAYAVVDLSGRAYFKWNVIFKREKIGDMPAEVFEDFFRAIAINLKATIHVNLHYGRNEHHMIECIFKAFARALRVAISKDKRLLGLLATTKGKL